MFRNYLKIALRNFKRHKGYSVLNVAGLAFGMACSILILLWVRDETRYDRFHANAADIYRVLQEVKFSDHETTWAITQGPLGPGLEKDFPEFARSVRLKGRRFQVRQGDTWVSETIWLADPSIFEVFTFPLAAGDPATALADIHSIILSEKVAARYFPAGDPLGQTLRLDGTFDFRVTGVMKTIPRNSHLQFDFLVPFAFGREIKLSVDRWNNSTFTTCLKNAALAGLFFAMASYAEMIFASFLALLSLILLLASWRGLREKRR